VVEALLAEYLAKAQVQNEARPEALRATIATWNPFGDENGSFADDHSTL
jgi:hypothetical protein